MRLPRFNAIKWGFLFSFLLFFKKKLLASIICLFIIPFQNLLLNCNHTRCLCRNPVDHFHKIVDEVTLKDITSISRKIISTPLAMASWGNGNSISMYLTLKDLISYVSVYREANRGV